MAEVDAPTDVTDPKSVESLRTRYLEDSYHRHLEAVVAAQEGNNVFNARDINKAFSTALGGPIMALKIGDSDPGQLKCRASES